LHTELKTPVSRSPGCSRSGKFKQENRVPARLEVHGKRAVFSGLEFADRLRIGRVVFDPAHPAGGLARNMENNIRIMCLEERDHDLDHAFRLADHMILMKEGAVVAEGTPEHLYTSGLIDRVFRVKLNRLQTESGWRYFCEPAQQ